MLAVCLLVVVPTFNPQAARESFKLIAGAVVAVAVAKGGKSKVITDRHSQAIIHDANSNNVDIHPAV